ncbi:MAG: rhodanese-like domain-containing protein [Planctomycetes bacterium]|nr:rhodanese-like domain-containing protein [Planctomycetota bacterium]
MIEFPIEIDVEEVKRRMDEGEELHLLDVREPEEIAPLRLPGAEEIPMMPLFLGTTRTTAPPEREVIVYCHHGIRSFEAAQLLRLQGFTRARSMAGGIEAWASRIDPAMRRY